MCGAVMMPGPIGLLIVGGILLIGGITEKIVSYVLRRCELNEFKDELSQGYYSADGKDFEEQLFNCIALMKRKYKERITDGAICYLDEEMVSVDELKGRLCHLTRNIGMDNLVLKAFCDYCSCLPLSLVKCYDDFYTMLLHIVVGHCDPNEKTEGEIVKAFLEAEDKKRFVHFVDSCNFLLKEVERGEGAN